MKDIKATFIEKLHECNQHKKRLISAKNRLQKYIPLSVQSYEALDDNIMSFVDQLIFRFSKLQDSMGEKIFPSVLELNGEEIKKKTFIDKLNRLEELELLSKNEWLELRKERNEIAHEYSFNQKEVVDSINLIYKETDRLLRIYDVFYRYCFDSFAFVAKSDLLEVTNQTS